MPKNKKPELSGLIVVDKPLGVTSHDVVAAVRGALGMRRVGHAGTLDPQASGVLVVGFGHGTRLLNYIVDHTKTYEATIRLGQTSTTDDSEGEITALAPVLLADDAGHITNELKNSGGLSSPRSKSDSGNVRVLTLQQIEQAIKEHLTGGIEQVPSSYSAVRVNGRHAYELARAGKDVRLDARRVTVNEFKVLDARTVLAPSDRTQAGSVVVDDPISGGLSADDSKPLDSTGSFDAADSKDSVDLTGWTGSADCPYREGRDESAGDWVPVVDVDVRISCSTGTYIRSLGRDLGRLLGEGGYLTRLRRTRVGRFDLEDPLIAARVVAAHPKPHTFTNREGKVVTLNKAVLDATPDELRQRALTMFEAVRCTMPLVPITADDAANLRFGRRLRMNLAQAVTTADEERGPVRFAAACVPETRELVAVLEPAGQNEVKSALVFPAPVSL
ncbi:tRNA pseudouridine(55) synthase [Bifidobacterium bohemicum]|uniref:tRNA pseudouridine synthase B n=1 Tax=Bifidobacterium bohemicum DSM 22767 TaxID=1437606 RepID=A0A086ZEF3_9BIFI|nr:tRNA pseudouridine(55) synthase TruB [Bifidobacterium bohemicum]KFI44903.1 tRNA pseudouridine synthase B [Bifidobacterium bohemicum DSM 22767]SCB96921.1 tRNA pseudouridine(55) synthase [Bifidobacterium bohemicum]